MILRSRSAGLALAGLGGLLQTASFAPLEWWPLQIAAMALLVLALRGTTPAQAAWRAWLFGFAGFTSGLWWIFISMHRYGGMPAPLAGMGVLCLAALLALHGAAAAALWRRIAGDSALAFAACWLLAELTRATLFTGFPWNAGGYAHTTGWLRPWAPWIGVYGIGALGAWLGAALAGLGGGLGARARRLAGPVLAVAVGALLPQQFTTASGSLAVSLLQTNVGQETKFDPEKLQAHVAALAEALRQARGDLVVTPESALPVPFVYLDPAGWKRLAEPFASGRRAALVGVFLGDESQGFVNSMVGMPPADPSAFYAYGKRHLLPFGEYVPPGFQWFVDWMQIPLGDQARGRSEASFEAGGQRLRPLICYEDLFGEDFADSVVGPGAATVLVNASNLAWFGRHLVQDQHLQASRMRAIEFQRPVIRATNTGATAVVDAAGRVTDRLPPFVRGVLEAKVEGRRGETPYARWLSQAGLWPLWLAAAGVLVFRAWRQRAAARAITGAGPSRYR